MITYVFACVTLCLQVEQLENQLLKVHEQKNEALTKDLLMYIKSMPETQLQVSYLSSQLGLLLTPTKTMLSLAFCSNITRNS